jgi:hypothetical protein
MDTTMERKRSLFEEQTHRAIQAKLGEAIRSLYELARPLPDRLYALVRELEQRGSGAITSDQPSEPKSSAGEPKLPEDHTSTEGNPGPAVSTAPPARNHGQS